MTKTIDNLPSMNLPDVFAANINRLAQRAKQGFAALGRGVVVVSFAAQQPQGIYYLPEAVVAEQFAEAPILLNLAMNAIEGYDPGREVALLALSEEGDEPLCWIIDFNQATIPLHGTH